MTKAGPYPIDSTAVVLVDPLNEFFSPEGKLWEITRDTVEKTGTIENLRRLTEGARGRGVKIVYALHHAHTGDDYDGWRFLNPSHEAAIQLNALRKGSKGMKILEGVQPQEGDIIAQEHWTASGFANTDLDMLLKQHGIAHVVAAGFRANTCVEATGRYAVELGYHATLVSDAIAALNDDEMNAAINVNWPAFGHAVVTTEGFLSSLSSTSTGAHS